MKTKRTLKLYRALDNGTLVSHIRYEAIKKARITALI
jgi:hypothetical protein